MIVTLQNVVDGNVNGKPLGDDERCYIFAMRFKPFIARHSERMKDFCFSLNYKGIKDIRPNPMLKQLNYDTEKGGVWLSCDGSFANGMKILRRAF